MQSVRRIQRLSLRSIVSRRVPRSLAFLAVVSLGFACGGDDDGDDATPTVEPTLASIQEKVFFPGCALVSCHDAQQPEEDLDLSTEAASRQALVDVDSIQVEQKRVLSGNPDESYLVEKLELDAPEEGERMPKSLAPLPDSTVDVIREWIAAGCP